MQPCTQSCKWKHTSCAASGKWRCATPPVPAAVPVMSPLPVRPDVLAGAVAVGWELQCLPAIQQRRRILAVIRLHHPLPPLLASRCRLLESVRCQRHSDGRWRPWTSSCFPGSYTSNELVNDHYLMRAPCATTGEALTGGLHPAGTSVEAMLPRPRAPPRLAACPAASAPSVAHPRRHEHPAGGSSGYDITRTNMGRLTSSTLLALVSATSTRRQSACPAAAARWIGRRCICDATHRTGRVRRLLQYQPSQQAQRKTHRIAGVHVGATLQACFDEVDVARRGGPMQRSASNLSSPQPQSAQ